MERKDHPNLIAAAIFAFVLGGVLLGLSLYSRYRGEPVETTALILGGALLLLAALAVEKHKELRAMTPEDRDRYWAAKDAEWQKTADAHARAQLGDEYDEIVRRRKGDRR